MDIFCEQLVTVKKTKSALVSKILIWVLAVLLAVLSFYFAVISVPYVFLLGAAVIYVAYKATTRMNIEFEYSLTNSTLDIDKIINKSDRKSVISFDCKDVFGVEKYNPQNHHDKSVKTYICTDNFDDAYLFSVNTQNGTEKVVFSPNEKLKNNFKRYIPRSVIGK